MLRTRSRTSTAFCRPRYASNAVSRAWIMASLISGSWLIENPLTCAGTSPSRMPL
jgi:hypothetical protein